MNTLSICQFCGQSIPTEDKLACTRADCSVYYPLRIRKPQKRYKLQEPQKRHKLQELRKTR